jgi:lipopolysaccharide export system permease protein
MPHLIDRYIFKEWLKALSVTVLLILGILLLEDMYRNLKNFLERGADAKTLLCYYGFVVPNCLGTVLPIAFFISVLYVLNDMQAHNEVVALRASGMTVFSITRGFWFAAVLLTGLLIGFNAYLLPYASDRMNTIAQQIDYNAQKKHTNDTEQIGIRYNLCFHHPTAGRLWRINRFGLYANRGTFTTLSMLDADGHERERIEAHAVSFEPSTHMWHFFNGKHWYFEEKSNTVRNFKPFAEETYDTFDETPPFMDCVHKPLKHLGAHELKQIINFFPENNTHFSEHRIAYASIASSPLICLMVLLLAIPFSLGGVRTNPMVGISKAVGLFFVYYLAGGFGRMLGTRGMLSPLAAAWFPNAIMLVFGLVLYRKLAPR